MFYLKQNNPVVENSPKCFVNTIYMSGSALTCYGREWGGGRREESRLHVNE